MSKECCEPESKMQKKLREFKPLILVLLFIVIADALLLHFLNLEGIMPAMRLFMGLFFLIFGLFKLLDLKGFVMSFAEYDLLAKHSKTYAYIYPFIELILGSLYLANLYPLQTNIATALLMFIGSIGVINVVWIKKRKIHCACLGAVIKLPMTSITVIEDVGMGLMALWMISQLM